jgi:Ribonuclease G/E
VESLLSPGQELLVQVTKEPMGGKGARVSGQISVPEGASSTFPGDADEPPLGGSGRQQERERLRQLVERIPGEGV